MRSHLAHLLSSMKPMKTILMEPLKNPQVVNLCELKPWEEGIPCTHNVYVVDFTMKIFAV